MRHRNVVRGHHKDGRERHHVADARQNVYEVDGYAEGYLDARGKGRVMVPVNRARKP